MTNLDHSGQISILDSRVILLSSIDIAISLLVGLLTFRQIESSERQEYCEHMSSLHSTRNKRATYLAIESCWALMITKTASIVDFHRHENFVLPYIVCLLHMC